MEPKGAKPRLGGDRRLPQHWTTSHPLGGDTVWAPSLQPPHHLLPQLLMGHLTRWTSLVPPLLGCGHGRGPPVSVAGPDVARETTPHPVLPLS